MSDIDYGAGSGCIRWIEKVDSIIMNSLSNYFNSGELIDSNLIDKLQLEIIQNKDAEFAFYCADEFEYKQYLMQKVILDTKDLKYAILFAKHIPNADIKALQKMIEQSGQVKYICNFALSVPRAQIKNLEKYIIKWGKVKYMVNYLNSLPHDDKPSKGALLKIKKAIFKSNNPEYLLALAHKVSTKQVVKQIENLLLETKSFTHLRLFAKIKHANKERIEQFFLESGNIEEIKKFAKDIKSSTMRAFSLLF
jgi:hypothetical protein